MAKLNLKRKYISSVLVLTALGFSISAMNDDKPKPADIISKHLAAIGTAEARADVHGTSIRGECLLTVREGGTGQAQGITELASLGDMNQLTLTFEEGTGPTWFKFDGSKTNVSQFRPGRRTSLEKFFADYQVIIKEGVFGGVLSESWALLKVESRNPKLEYGGTKEVKGKQLAVLKYVPRKGSELKILLFFEPDTFRHVRTEYSQTIYVTDQQRIPGGGGGLPNISGQRASNTRIQAVEEFADFKEEKGLSLPHTYSFDLEIQSDINPALVTWMAKLSEFSFSSPFDPKDSAQK